MRYPFYGVTSRCLWKSSSSSGPRHEGSFYTYEEAKECFDSVPLDHERIDVSLVVFYEDYCETLDFKEQELKLPTSETMGRANYIPIKEIARRRRQENEDDKVKAGKD